MRSEASSQLEIAANPTVGAGSETSTENPEGNNTSRPMPDYYECLKDAPTTKKRPVPRASRRSRTALIFNRDGCHILAFADDILKMVQEQTEQEQDED